RLREPELSLALKWQREQRPTPAAAARYGADARAVLSFIDTSARANKVGLLGLWGAIGAVIAGLAILGVMLAMAASRAAESQHRAEVALSEQRHTAAELAHTLAKVKTATVVVLARDAAVDTGRAGALLRETPQAPEDRSAAWNDAAVAVARLPATWVLKGHGDNVAAAHFSPDARRVVTASWDNTARVWDAESGRELKKLSGHDGWVYEAR